MSKATALLPCSSAASLLPDDLLMEVFVRLPPEPGHLLAASLVCRRWCRLVRDRSFLRRFCGIHRAPPMLGYFEKWKCGTHCSTSSHRMTRFVPAAGAAAATFRLSLPEQTRRVLDCRHGRVLLYSHADKELVVWDPMAGDTHRVRVPWSAAPDEDKPSAALVCAADDHTGGHSRPLKIVFLSWYYSEAHGAPFTGACVYSSETTAWGGMTLIKAPPPVTSLAAAVVGDSVCWLISTVNDNENRFLEVALPEQRMSLIEPPESIAAKYEMVRVMQAADGGVGFVGVHDEECTLDFWSRQFDSTGLEWWVLIKVADLRSFTSPDVDAEDLCLCPAVIGFAEHEDVLFVDSQAGFFMINMRSKQITEVSNEILCDLAIFPYSSFYRRGRDIVGIDDGDLQ